ncbi:hypothetical protein LSH36_20g05036 [Paralvinella palmiformis]|uniref:Uncharacterized protein n=1 Tax=Paralvinella palmiformis TaxID=53620 RepID=A0AAD9KBL3_9ANNE|nr:hypothetical protein LSH36_20g05036 [Paralvinella palmiformis]
MTPTLSAPREAVTSKVAMHQDEHTHARTHTHTRTANDKHPARYDQARLEMAQRRTFGYTLCPSVMFYLHEDDERREEREKKPSKRIISPTNTTTRRPRSNSSVHN